MNAKAKKVRKAPALRIEDAAHRVTVTGWACVACGAFYGEYEAEARECCADNFPCACGGRYSSDQLGKCVACRQKIEREHRAADVAKLRAESHALPLCRRILRPYLASKLARENTWQYRWEVENLYEAMALRGMLGTFNRVWDELEAEIRKDLERQTRR